MKEYLKRTLLVLLGLLIAFLLAEGIVTIYRLAKYHTLRRDAPILHRQNVLTKILGASLVANPNRRWENTLVIHPLFGYTYNPNHEGVNNFGFRTKYDIVLSDFGYSIAHHRPRNELLIVGIFGGSFAEMVGSHRAYLEKKLITLFPDKVPVVMTFGVGGHALPQSAFIYIYFKDLFDIIIFIDGLNELWNAVENNRSGYPPEYAKAAHFQYKLSLNELTPGRFIHTSKIISLKQKLAKITMLSLNSLVKHSLVVHYLWLYLAHRWSYQIDQESLLIKKSYEQNPNFFHLDEKNILDHAARQWTSYHNVIEDIASNEETLAIHLLQPNPFVPNSKKLTNDEVRLVTRSYPVKDFVLEGYPQLREGIARLRKEEIIAEDLSYMYRDVEEPIWVDAAHPNKRGRKLIMDKVFSILEKDNVTKKMTISR